MTKPAPSPRLASNATPSPSSDIKANQSAQLSSTTLPVNAQYYDVIIIGAGASGLYCALTAGNRGRKVLVLDHANKAGKKILMSGGGRCNFTNYVVEPEHFIGDNPHFCKSALSRYSSWEFIGMVAEHAIPYHEREHGQLFCDDSSKDILAMLLKECDKAGAQVQLKTDIIKIQPLTLTKTDPTQPVNFLLQTSKGDYTCESLVIATGGLSIPTLGASGFGYEVATQFGHSLHQTDAALVPFTFTDKVGDVIKSLTGLSLPVIAFNERISFKLPMLFTHRGLSGPAMLQLSNYWYPGERIHINLLPDIDVTGLLLAHKASHPKQLIRSVLAEHFPKKLLMGLQSLLWEDIKSTEL
ncbi:MAG: aminoacetone oxidase family FAD-binding enzyme, partial [Psychrobacter sp.]|nr:aminoacetone oxidase family FAD-binding enzyme [Psychrobacter sp.]